MMQVVQSTLYPDELYERFLFHLTAAMAAPGSAIWRLEQENVSLSASRGASDAQGRQAWGEHRDCIASRIRASVEQETVLPGDPGNPSSLVLLLQRVHPRCPLVIEVAQRDDAQAQSLRGYALFLKQAAEILSNAKCIPWE
jgi:hypothetical protein